MNGVVLVGARSSLLHSCNEWLCILGVDDTSDSPVTKYTISLISVGFCVAISLVANCVVSSNPEKQMIVSSFGLFAALTTVLVVVGSKLQDSDTPTEKVIVNIGIAVCSVVTILLFIGAASFLDPTFLSNSKKVVVGVAFVTSLLATKNSVITIGSRAAIGGTSAVIWTLLSATTIKASYDQDEEEAKDLGWDHEKIPLTPSPHPHKSAVVPASGEEEIPVDNADASSVSVEEEVEATADDPEGSQTASETQ
jgi:hypothetical protein